MNHASLYYLTIYLENQLLATIYGGEMGIRTPDRAFRPYNGLANRRLQPLGHLSAPLWIIPEVALPCAKPCLPQTPAVKGIETEIGRLPDLCPGGEGLPPPAPHFLGTYYNCR